MTNQRMWAAIAVVGFLGIALIGVACTSDKGGAATVTPAATTTAAPLDAVYGLRWDLMSQLERWWAASSGGVGPSPPLAPAALAMTALCVVLATWRHPAGRSR